MQYFVGNRLMNEHEYEAHIAKRWRWVYRLVVFMAALFFLPDLICSWDLQAILGWWTEPVALAVWLLIFESLRRFLAASRFIDS